MNTSRSILRVADQHHLGSATQCGVSLAKITTLTPVHHSHLLGSNRRVWTAPRQRITTIFASSSKNNGNLNRLGPSKQQRSSSAAAPITSTGGSRSSSSTSSLNNLLDPFFESFSELVGRTMYNYYNWRQDTLSDLLLFAVLNTIIIALGAALKGSLAPSSFVAPDISSISTPSQLGIDAVDVPLPPPSWWQNLYSVLTVVLGQELPEEQASNFSQQLFAVATAVLGVASFALVLALIEQATLELLENNVRRGSRVYEKDHYVILTYGESARDLSQCQTITEQMCAASAASGGAVIVILVAHREKLEMETLFREALPVEARCGSQIVFRQGSPLDPGALEMVSATDARAIVISGDYSRSVEDSDAQVLRCAVLIDEMSAAVGKEWIDSSTSGSGTVVLPSSSHNYTSSPSSFGTTNGMGPWVIAEVQGTNVTALLQYACTPRVIAVPSSTINARRYARLLKHPAVATLSHALFDHKSRSNCHVGYFPDASWLVGQKFSDLHAFFPDAIVSGLIDVSTWKSELSCPPDRVFKQGEALVMLRPAVGVTKHVVRPLRYAMPAALDPGSTWDPNLYSLRSIDDAPLGKDASGVRVCSWNRNFLSNASGSGGGGLSVVASNNGSNIDTFTNGVSGNSTERPRAPPPRGPGYDNNNNNNNNTNGNSTETDDEDNSSSLRKKHRRHNQSQANRRLGASLLPLSYGSTATGENINNATIGSDLLICGWPGATAMVELLKELDQGVEALPQGSRVILLNNHSWEEVSTQCCLGSTIQRLEIKHVRCDPRDRQQLSTSLDVATLRAAVILHDKNWGMSSNGGVPAYSGGSIGSTISNTNSTTSTGATTTTTTTSFSPYRAAAEASAYSLSQSDMLRMDAAVLEVQLNVRYLLETSCCPDINILSEKLTYLGQTRFENRTELPIGAAVNSASFAAKVLAQTAVQPRSLTAYGQVGVQCEIVVQDAAAFAKEGEELNFFNLQARCASVSQVLLGYYDLPSSIDEVLNIVVNPDPEDRVSNRVWNAGDSRCKLITLAPRAAVAKSLKKVEVEADGCSSGGGGEIVAGVEVTK